MREGTAAAPSVPGNFLFASLSGFLNVFVPILTYPYIARVLGPEKLGQLGIAGALSNYFIVAALLGLPVYGVRAIARTKADPLGLGRTSGELILLGLYAAILSSLFYVLIVLLVPAYRSELLLFLVFGITIPSAAMNIEWFFQGMERFRFIGLRNLAIKIVFVVSLFLFVRRQEDYIVYALLFSLASVTNAFINLRAARKIASPLFAGAHPSRHFASMAVFSLFQFAIVAYTNLDLLFLGLFSSGRDAGLYSISIRLVRMVIALATTLSAVLMPRLSSLVDSDPEEFGRLIGHSSSYSLMFSLPAGFGICAVAADLGYVFAGSRFLGVADSLRIAAFIIPVVTVSNFLQMQILVPKRREKAMLFSFGAGLVVTAIVLAFLVGPYGHVGAAVGMLAGEVTVLLVHAFLCGGKDLRALVDLRAALRYLAGAVGSAGFASLPRLFMRPGLARLAVSITLAVLVYAAFLLALEDSAMYRLLDFLKAKLGRRGRGRFGGAPGETSGRSDVATGEPVRVLHVINSLAAGGAEKLLAELLPRLQERDIECNVLALDGRASVFARELEAGGVRVDFAVLKAGKRAKPAFSPLRVFSIMKKIRDFDPDIVHSHLGPSFHWCAVASVFARGRRFVTTEHASENRRMAMPLLRGFEKWCYGRYDSIVCVSPSVAQALGDWLGLGGSGISVAPNGVPLDRFASARAPAADVAAWLAGRCGIVMVARFVPAKDHETAIRALASLPENHALVLVGDGDEKPGMERLAKTLGVAERCLFTGSRNDVPEILAACEVYLQTSRKEGFGIAALEAMAAGLPVAAADVPGLGPLVAGAGLLFPAGEWTAAARRILELEEPDARKTAVDAGKARAAGYSIEATVGAYAELYGRLKESQK